MDALGWDSCDVILVTGDAYIDHPSFGMALIGRLLEAQGFRVGIIAQPDWKSADPFRALGRPNLYFGVTAGNMDSMVNRYTSDRKIRSDDAYTPNAAPDKRPDRALTVYAQRCREAYKDVAVVIGGIEGSLRRIAHYDYWSDTVRRSVLLDSKADMLLFGNAERALVELTHRLADGEVDQGHPRPARQRVHGQPRLEAFGRMERTGFAGDGYAGAGGQASGSVCINTPLPRKRGRRPGETNFAPIKPMPTALGHPPPPQASPASGNTTSSISTVTSPSGSRRSGSPGNPGAAVLVAGGNGGIPSASFPSKTVSPPSTPRAPIPWCVCRPTNRSRRIPSCTPTPRACSTSNRIPAMPAPWCRRMARRGLRDVWLNPPPIPLTTPEMDAVFDAPYARAPHPAYGDNKIPAWEMIRFSVNIMRGCFGGCTFCSITEHEGRIIQSRSEESILHEIEAIRDKTPGFTGVISDLGGPTANMYRLACKDPKIESACRRLSCVFPDICENLNTDHTR
jgi:radical SAM superfamily enzyme YgiQ (UPF0313 family)